MIAGFVGMLWNKRKELNEEVFFLIFFEFPKKIFLVKKFRRFFENPKLPYKNNPFRLLDSIGSVVFTSPGKSPT